MGNETGRERKNGHGRQPLPAQKACSASQGRKHLGNRSDDRRRAHGLLGMVQERRHENAVRILRGWRARGRMRSEEHTVELQSLMRNEYDVFCLYKETN